MDKSPMHVAMPDAPSPVALPSGWTAVDQGELLTVVGPESDLTLSFVASPAATDTEELFRLA